MAYLKNFISLYIKVEVFKRCSKFNVARDNVARLNRVARLKYLKTSLLTMKKDRERRIEREGQTETDRRTERVRQKVQGQVAQQVLN
jgi:hypothetical protein